MNRNRHRAGWRELFDGRDVGDRLFRAEHLGVAAAKGLGVSVGEHARPHAIGRGGERGLQPVGPGRGNCADPGFERGALDDGSFAFIAPDDVVNARQRPFRE